MPVTLTQAALNTQDDLEARIIDEFRKASAILDTLIFHDAVSPMGGGATLTYGYHRNVTERSAAFRAINNEYDREKAEKERFTVDLKPLGGKFAVDRVLAQIARGAEVSYQLEQVIKATRAKFTDELINGDEAVDANGFDGLDKALTGTDTEIDAGDLPSDGDWSDLDGDKSHLALDGLDEFFSVLDGPPSMLVGNDKSLARIRAVARRANQYVTSPIPGLTDGAGAPIVREWFGNTVLVDAGAKAGSNDRIVPIYQENATFELELVDNPDGGDFKLTVVRDGASDETDAIAHDANAAAIKTALEALDNVGDDEVEVTTEGDVHTIVFLPQAVWSMSVDDNVDNGSVTISEETAAADKGLTDLYVYRIGMDGFHGVSVAGQPLLQTWMPDFTTSGAVKDGEVEMGPVATALKATKAAAVLRGIKVR